jgi:hypothetical protein
MSVMETPPDHPAREQRSVLALSDLRRSVIAVTVVSIVVGVIAHPYALHAVVRRRPAPARVAGGIDRAYAEERPYETAAREERAIGEDPSIDKRGSTDEGGSTDESRSTDEGRTRSKPATEATTQAANMRCSKTTAAVSAPHTAAVSAPHTASVSTPHTAAVSTPATAAVSTATATTAATPGRCDGWGKSDRCTDCGGDGNGHEGFSKHGSVSSLERPPPGRS